jgi:2-amino-4-hydroxy-6-hydroxymethyldihydropteridine diphosphokinase
MHKKQLNSSNKLIFNRYYPYLSKKEDIKKKKVLLGIGGNIGDVVRRFIHLFYYFKKSKFLNIIETAPILKNPPFGYLEQDDFYNSLIVVETNLTPKKLLKYLLHVEKIFSRKRLFKDAPRTLDIDIIFYENIKINTTILSLPHPQWSKRDSVLIPLKYLSKIRKYNFFDKQVLVK